MYKQNGRPCSKYLINDLLSLKDSLVKTPMEGITYAWRGSAMPGSAACRKHRNEELTEHG